MITANDIVIQRRGLPLEEHTKDVLEFYDRLALVEGAAAARGGGSSSSSSNGSKVMLASIPAAGGGGNNNNETDDRTIIRLCHIQSLLPTTNRDGSLVKTWGIYSEAVAFLSMLHFNQRDWTVVPELRQLQSCNVQFTMNFRDTKWSIQEAVRVLTQDVMPPIITTTEKKTHQAAAAHPPPPPPPPIAIAGALRSAVTGPLALLSNLLYEIPVISYGSLSTELEDRNEYPYFARIPPTVEGEARAAAQFFRQVLNVYHMGIFYSTDSFGRSYYQSFVNALQTLDPPMKVVEAPYHPARNQDHDVRKALRGLKESGYRYFFGVMPTPVWETFLEQATQLEIIGQPGYTWMFGSESSHIYDPNKSYDATNHSQTKRVRALHGSAVITPHFEHQPIFDEVWASLERNQDLKTYFVNQHMPTPTSSSSLTHATGTQLNFTDFTPGSYEYFQYDAIMALGFAACGATAAAATNTSSVDYQTPIMTTTNSSSSSFLFTGPELYDSLMRTSFTGASGRVEFDRSTGNRNTKFIPYKIVNVLAKPPNQENRIYFDAPITHQQYNQSWKPQQQQQPSNGSSDPQNYFIFADGTHHLPPDIPPLSMMLDNHQIGKGLLGFGWTLAGLCILASIMFGGWTMWHRRSPLVARCQPFFLLMVCFGTFLMGCSIIPMGFQEPMRQSILDAGCMMTPWFFSCGYVVSFSGLFSKTIRVYKLMKSSKSFQRVIVRVQDVMVPFCILGKINVTILVCMTVIAPLEWVRVPDGSIDQFGRHASTYGSCQSSDRKLETLFYFLLFSVKTVTLLGANIANYKARNLSHQLHESGPINVAMAIMLEACLIGAPAMLVLQDNPSANFVVRSVLVAIICGAILLPMFMPKVVFFDELNTHEGTPTSIARPQWSSATQQGSVAAIRAGVSGANSGTSASSGLSNSGTSASSWRSTSRGALMITRKRQS